MFVYIIEIFQEIWLFCSMYWLNSMKISLFLRKSKFLMIQIQFVRVSLLIQLYLGISGELLWNICNLHAEWLSWDE